MNHLQTEITYIVNPNAKSGRGIQKWEALQRELRRFGYEAGVDYQVCMTECPGQASGIVQKLTKRPQVRDGALHIILGVIGGDGTLDEVVNGIVYPENTSVLYVPAGSGNDFARSTGVETDPVKAVALLQDYEKHMKAYDWGRMQILEPVKEIRRFAESAGVGYDADVCKAIMRSKVKSTFNRIGLGKLAYTFLGIIEMFRCKPVDGWIEVDGERVEFHHMFFTSFHVHPYEGGGFMFAPGTDAEDGMLDVSMVSGVNRLGFILALLGALFRRFERCKGVQRFRCHKCKIHLNRPRQSHCDGEMMGFQKNIAFDCQQGKLHLIQKSLHC